MRKRLITGPILIFILLVLVYVDDWLDTVQFQGSHPPRGLVLFIFMLVVVIFAAQELAEIFRAQHIKSFTWLNALAAMAGVVVSYCIPIAWRGQHVDAVTAIAILSSVIISVLVISLLTFSRQKNVEGVVAAAGAVMFGMVHLGLMSGFLLALRREHSAWWIVGILLVTKMGDTGAYFMGKAIGRHKLIPWLSPGKTWEGLVGAVLLAGIVGALAATASQRFLEPIDHISLEWGIACGVVFALVGQFGDLIMSLLKRGAGLKDASRLLPGLGGALDVVDSPLMVAPFAFWMLQAASSGAS